LKKFNNINNNSNSLLQTRGPYHGRNHTTHEHKKRLAIEYRITESVFALDQHIGAKHFNSTPTVRPAQHILPIRPWPYLFSDSTTRFSF